MNKTEELLMKVIDVFAERFDKHAVLRGGMALRVLGCDRMTNDVDYVFVPFKSKKNIVDDVIAALKGIDGATVRYSMNSKCLRAVLTVGEVSVQIEIKTATEIPVSVLANKDLAVKYGLPPRLIPVVDYPVALSNKMAAWNERRLIRDIYDIWFYLKMGIRPDEPTLYERLSKPNYSRLVKKKDYFTSQSPKDFYGFLSEKIQALTDKEIAASLSDYLPATELAGLAMRFRAEIAKLQ